MCQNLQEQVKKVFCLKNCSDFSLLKQIVLVIEKNFLNSKVEAEISQQVGTILETTYQSCSFFYLKHFHLLLVISCHREITNLYQYPLYIALWSKRRDKVIMLDSNHPFLESNWFGINSLDLLSKDSSIPRGDSYYLEFWALCL